MKKLKSLVRRWCVMARIKIDEIENEIAKELKTYTKEVEEGLEDEKKKAARKGVKMLKDTSPQNRPRYKDGWGSVKQGTARVIRNRTDYQLTHLLERSHTLRDGGRSTPQVHIKPAEEHVIKEYTEGVERVIKS